MRDKSTDRQILLELAVRPALDREAFFVSASNRDALALIEGWRDWPDGRMCLTGDAGLGKTHLAHVWTAMADPARSLTGPELTPALAARIGGDEHVLIDRAESFAEETAFLHLVNRLAAGGGRLLCVSRLAPAEWPVSLADLGSRLAAMAVARLEAPDDELLAALFVKLFHDRQINVSDKVIGYLTLRIERSGAAVGRIVDALDTLSLRRKKPITQGLAAQVLEAAGQGVEG